MAKGKAAMEALEALLSGVKRVDLGDMTRPVTGARKEALEEMLPKVDDWGWKGGKPGEITGIDFQRQIRNADFEGNERKLKTIYEKARRQLSGDRKLKDSEVFTAMNQFAEMERAGIPRKYTGKVYKTAGELISNRNAGDWISHPKYIRGLTTENVALLLSSQLRPLSHKQRIIALDLLPHWSRSLDELGYAAKDFEKMTNDQREIFVALLPEWSGSLDELAETARLL